jgi:hypothetical protein
MGFYKTAANEFGKKTGKALGNKMYGAYADDKRVGVNRGKLKGESDGVKIVTWDSQQKSFITETDPFAETRYNKRQEQFENILNIELNPGNKNSLIKALTELSVYVELWAKESKPDKHLSAAKSKFDSGVIMLQAIDPNNPMVYYFLQKQMETKTEARKQKRNENLKEKIIPWIVIIIVLAIGVISYLIADEF